jgi:hypothetical protein
VDQISPTLLTKTTRRLTCRKCQAPPGFGCTSLDGTHRDVKTHRERVADARAMLATFLDPVMVHLDRATELRTVLGEVFAKDGLPRSGWYYLGRCRRHGHQRIHWLCPTHCSEWDAHHTARNVYDYTPASERDLLR